MEASPLAVDVSHVRYSYDKKLEVLQGVDLRVKKGNIYGLLGPSGCGKTTLLRLTIGRLKLQTGSVHVCGYAPGSIESNIPGSRVGYMPQELALYQTFTISETLHFFGRIHNMTAEQIKNRMDFLRDFLDLPPETRKTSQLSGGQQRRLSLAVALLHSPEILILDEPTVGVDPVLRVRIWDHLVSIANTEHTSIIITTHYIDEARQADCVGLMRHGKVLAEGPPERLIEKLGLNTLEEVFLHLCMKDNCSPTMSMEGNEKIPDETKALIKHNGADNHHVDVKIVDPYLGDSMENSLLLDQDDTPHIRYEEAKQSCVRRVGHAMPKGQNLLALFIKNMHELRGKLIFMLFQSLMPAVMITFFALCVGGTPKDLPVTIVNEDVGLQSMYGLNLSFSDAYIDGLDPVIIRKEYKDTLDEAIGTVEAGDAWAVVYMATNFSIDTAISSENASSSQAVKDGAMIQIWMDYTDQEISATLTTEFNDAYQILGDSFKQQALDRYGISDLPVTINIDKLPIEYNEPIYGEKDLAFLDFIAPGVVGNVMFTLAIGLTSMTFIMEKMEGLLERSLISGVTVSEIMLGHICTEFFIMSIQLTVLMVFAFAVFQVYNVGSYLIIVMFGLLLGMIGMSYGFFISAAAPDAQAASSLSTATVMPFMLVSGIIWPLQSQDKWVQYISMCLPLTLPIEGLRSVVGRGWGFDHYVVWRGYTVGVAWVFILLIVSLACSRYNKMY